MPRVNRLVTTSSPMDDEATAHVIQVWDLKTLKLLKTVPLEPRTDTVSMYPFEIRKVGKGDVAMMNTYYCGLYVIDRVTTDAPRVRHVMNMDEGKIGCGVPLVIDKFWIMPVAYDHALLVFDVSDPEHPRQVSRFETPADFRPHWTSGDPNSDRIVVTGQGDGTPAIYFLKFSRVTGTLAMDEAFRADLGGAHPHGALFLK
jgi:hypothetical protein